MKKTYFDEKLINTNKKGTSNKAKHVEAEKELNDHTTSCTKILNGLTREVKI